MEVGVDHLAGLAPVEHSLLGQRVADPHRDPAKDLVVEGQPVEHPARVVGGDKPDDPDLPGSGVDLDLTTC